MLHHVKPAVSKGYPIDGGEAVITIHVAKSTDPFVSGSAVEFDQQGVLVVTDIADVAQAVPALLPKPLGKPCGRSTLRRYDTSSTDSAPMDTSSMRT